MLDSEERDVFMLDAGNPVPFSQPFLVIVFKNGEHWNVDVNGQIDKYLSRYTEVKNAFLNLSEKERQDKKLPIGCWSIFGDCSDWRSQATPLFLEMLIQLDKLGFSAIQVYGYAGSAGPSHVIVNGALFERTYRKNVAKKAKRLQKDELLERNLDVAKHISKLLP